MEANFFRFLAEELARSLTGSRIEKIHSPGDGVLLTALYGSSGKTNLILRPAKTAGLLFCSAEKPRNPAEAPARVMWLRKRLSGRRLLSARVDWPNLRLAFELSPREIPGAGVWLVLDLREGLSLDEAFPAPPEATWPPLARVLDDESLWREHPQLTPPLRKRLRALSESAPHSAAALYSRLERGAPEGFFAPGRDGKGVPLVWQEDGSERHATAMEAARAHGERVLFTALGAAEERDQLDQAQAARRKLKRQLALLDRDEGRHKTLVALSIPAEALQIALSSLPRTPGTGSIVLDHPEHGPQTVPLDPRLSPSENLAQLFRQSAKGRRGLEHVARRRELLLAGQPMAKNSHAPQVPVRHATMLAPPPVLPKRYAGLAVALFQTSDGFTVLRGKSSQANHEMLSKAASPHDYWLHAAGGPSAHVILRRDHPGQEVPEQSLVEAATLCAIKSWRKDDAKAEVLCALVKDVRKVKGAAIGSVAVDEVERVLVVRPNAELETRLAVQPVSLPDPARRRKK